jgi:hypothetical protein
MDRKLALTNFVNGSNFNTTNRAMINTVNPNIQAVHLVTNRTEKRIIAVIAIMAISTWFIAGGKVGVRQQNGSKYRMALITRITEKIRAKVGRSVGNSKIPFGAVKTQQRIVSKMQAVGNQKSR